MSSLFSNPKFKATPQVDTADTQNRLNDAMTRQLASGGTNSTFLTQAMNGAPTGGSAAPSLTGVTH